MMPIGPLMIEHRLIERMIKLMDQEVGRIRQTGQLHVGFHGQAIDFVKTYADRCHHGKEEDILFRDLELKPLTDEHRHIMDELIAEHAWARQKVAQWVGAKELCDQGDPAALRLASEIMAELAQFYPKHIAKEDKHFFIPVMSYFSKAEQEQMLQAFWEFDRKLIHEKYRQVVDSLGG
jgi:hemerythrin-like domain-containing protein